MSWEFRKLGPGENVAVEAQRDPFAAPKWAPRLYSVNLTYPTAARYGRWQAAVFLPLQSPRRE